MASNGSLTGLRAELDSMERGDLVARAVRCGVNLAASDTLDSHRRGITAAVAKAKQRHEGRDFCVQTLDGLSDGMSRATRVVVIERTA